MDSHLSGANTLRDIALPTNTATDIGKQECFQGLIHTCLREGICASGSVEGEGGNILAYSASEATAFQAVEYSHRIAGSIRTPRRRLQ